MEILVIISIVSLSLALLSSAVIVWKLNTRSQPMKIMNVVWPLTAFWGGLAVLWAFFSFGRPSGKQKMSMSDMKDMPEMDMKMDMDMGQTPFWQKIALSTFHCGAGCTLADLIGESAGTGLLRSFGLYDIGWQWGLDYLLALVIGAFFQYAAIRPMSKKEPAGEVFVKALKIDFLSLTSWQIGMYVFSYILFFIIFPQPFSHASWSFWFIMQLSMCAGFLCSYPMNWFLVKKGIKPAM